MIVSKRDKTVAKMLDIMNDKKTSGHIIIQVDWDKNEEFEDFNITCASVCALYYKINQEWRDHIIDIEHTGTSSSDSWKWILDKTGERKRNKDKKEHQI